MVAKCDNGKINVIVHKASDGNYKVCMNKCEHMGGSFVPDLEDIGKMKCSMHGWKLDPATMTYCTGSHPAILGMQLKKFNENAQPELSVSVQEDGSILITDVPASSSACTIAQMMLGLSHKFDLFYCEYAEIVDGNIFPYLKKKTRMFCVTEKFINLETRMRY